MPFCVVSRWDKPGLAPLLEAEVADATPTLSLLPLALANRTLLLTGDSVTRDTFHVLVRLIATPHEPRTTDISTP